MHCDKNRQDDCTFVMMLTEASSACKALIAIHVIYMLYCWVPH